MAREDSMYDILEEDERKEVLKQEPQGDNFFTSAKKLVENTALQISKTIPASKMALEVSGEATKQFLSDPVKGVQDLAVDAYAATLKASNYFPHLVKALAKDTKKESSEVFDEMSRKNREIDRSFPGTPTPPKSSQYLQAAKEYQSIDEEIQANQPKDLSPVGQYLYSALASTANNLLWFGSEVIASKFGARLPIAATGLGFQVGVQEFADQSLKGESGITSAIMGAGKGGAEFLGEKIAFKQWEKVAEKGGSLIRKGATAWATELSQEYGTEITNIALDSLVVDKKMTPMDMGKRLWDTLIVTSLSLPFMHLGVKGIDATSKIVDAIPTSNPLVRLQANMAKDALVKGAEDGVAQEHIVRAFSLLKPEEARTVLSELQVDQLKEAAKLSKKVDSKIQKDELYSIKKKEEENRVLSSEELKKFGVVYNGEQENAEGEAAYSVYTDNKTQSTFMVKTRDEIEPMLAGVRKRFEDNEKGISSFEEVMERSIADTKFTSYVADSLEEHPSKVAQAMKDIAGGKENKESSLHRDLRDMFEQGEIFNSKKTSNVKKEPVTQEVEKKAPPLSKEGEPLLFKEMEGESTRNNLTPESKARIDEEFAEKKKSEELKKKESVRQTSFWDEKGDLSEEVKQSISKENSSILESLDKATMKFIDEIESEKISTTEMGFDRATIEEGLKAVESVRQQVENRPKGKRVSWTPNEKTIFLRALGKKRLEKMLGETENPGMKKMLQKALNIQEVKEEVSKEVTKKVIEEEETTESIDEWLSKHGEEFTEDGGEELYSIMKKSSKDELDDFMNFYKKGMQEANVEASEASSSQIDPFKLINKDWNDMSEEEKRVFGNMMDDSLYAISKNKQKLLGVEKDKAAADFAGLQQNSWIQTRVQLEETVKTSIEKLVKAFGDSKSWFYRSEVDIDRQIAKAREMQREGNLIGAMAEALENLSNNEESKQEYSKKILAIINKNTKATLKGWFDYLVDNDTYSPYFISRMIGKIASQTVEIENGTKKVYKLSKDTIDRLPLPMDIDAVASFYNRLQEGKIEGKNWLSEYLDDLTRISKARSEQRDSVITKGKVASGKWIHFKNAGKVSEKEFEDQVAELTSLAQDTPWCTKSLARSQLQEGQHWTFVDDQGKARLTFWLEKSGEMREARGVLPSQAIEPELTDVMLEFVEKAGIKGGKDFVNEELLKKELLKLKKETDNNISAETFEAIAEKHGYELKSSDEEHYEEIFVEDGVAIMARASRDSTYEFMDVDTQLEPHLTSDPTRSIYSKVDYSHTNLVKVLGLNIVSKQKSLNFHTAESIDILDLNEIGDLHLPNLRRAGTIILEKGRSFSAPNLEEVLNLEITEVAEVSLPRLIEANSVALIGVQKVEIPRLANLRFLGLEKVKDLRFESLIEVVNLALKDVSTLRLDRVKKVKEFEFLRALDIELASMTDLQNMYSRESTVKLPELVDTGYINFNKGELIVPKVESLKSLEVYESDIYAPTLHLVKELSLHNLYSKRVEISKVSKVNTLSYEARGVPGSRSNVSKLIPLVTVVERLNLYAYNTDTQLEASKIEEVSTLAVGNTVQAILPNLKVIKYEISGDNIIAPYLPNLQSIAGRELTNEERIKYTVNPNLDLKELPALKKFAEAMEEIAYPETEGEEGKKLTSIQKSQLQKVSNMGKALDYLAKDSSNRDLQDLNKLFQTHVNEEGRQIPFFWDPANKHEAVYTMLNEKGELDEKFTIGTSILDYDADEVHRVLTHEILHSLTALKMRKDPAFKAQVEKLRKEAYNKLYPRKTKGRELADSYLSRLGKAAREGQAAVDELQREMLPEFRKEDMSIDDLYGFLRAEEFLSEAYTNGSFREELKKIASKSSLRGSIKSIWQSFINSIKEAFGIEKSSNILKSNILEKVIETTTPHFRFFDSRHRGEFDPSKSLTPEGQVALHIAQLDESRLHASILKGRERLQKLEGVTHERLNTLQEALEIRDQQFQASLMNSLGTILPQGQVMRHPAYRKVYEAGMAYTEEWEVLRYKYVDKGLTTISKGMDKELKYRMADYLQGKVNVPPIHKEKVKEVRDFLDSLYNLAAAGGYDINYEDKYFPHVFDSYSVTFTNELSMFYPTLDEAIKAAAEGEAKGKELSFLGPRMQADAMDLYVSNQKVLTLVTNLEKQLKIGRKEFLKMAKEVLGEDVSISELLKEVDKEHLKEDGENTGVRDALHQVGIKANPRSRFVANMKERETNNPNYKTSFDEVMYAYTYNIAKAISQDKFLKEITPVIEKLESNSQKVLKDYRDRILGRPTAVEETLASLWTTLSTLSGLSSEKRSAYQLREHIHTLAGIQYVADMGFMTSSALTNSTQLFTNTASLLGYPRVLIAAAKASKALISGESEDFKELVDHGIIEEVSSGLESNYSKTLSLPLLAFQVVEKFNRASTYFAAKAYVESQGADKAQLVLRTLNVPSTARVLRLPLAPKMDLELFKNEFAKELVNNTQFRAEPFSAPSLFTNPLTKVVAPYKNYLINQHVFMFNVLKNAVGGNSEARKALARFLAATLLLGGHKANVLIQSLTALVNEAYKEVFSQGIYDIEVKGVKVGDILESGVPSVMGFDMSSAISFFNPLDVQGGIIPRMVKGIVALFDRDTATAWKNLMPRVGKEAERVYTVLKEEKYKDSEGRMIDAVKKIDAAKIALGFKPDTINLHYRLKDMDSEVKEWYKDNIQRRINNWADYKATKQEIKAEEEVKAIVGKAKDVKQMFDKVREKGDSLKFEAELGKKLFMIEGAFKSDRAFKTALMDRLVPYFYRDKRKGFKEYNYMIRNEYTQGEDHDNLTDKEQDEQRQQLQGGDE